MILTHLKPKTFACEYTNSPPSRNAEMPIRVRVRGRSGGPGRPLVETVTFTLQSCGSLKLEVYCTLGWFRDLYDLNYKRAHVFLRARRFARRRFRTVYKLRDMDTGQAFSGCVANTNRKRRPQRTFDERVYFALASCLARGTNER